ncbi:MAG: hypothetical protein IKU44_03100 [Firmicutes bacterium]|nr:hypothetical protein [Bacillota bacterium]
MKKIKKKIAVLIAIFCIVGSAFVIYQSVFVDENIPRGYTDYAEHYDPNGFMDWSHYCWYQYKDAGSVRLPSDYQVATEKDVAKVKDYFENTRDWMQTCDRLEEYDFDSACINEGDSFLLFTSEGEARGSGVYGKYDNYTVYFFDKETARLYYINNNN